MINPDFKDIIEKLDFENTSKHIFICVAPENSKCCNLSLAAESWEYLKRRTKELKETNNIIIQRSKVGCLRICKGGPVLLIQPDNIYYHSATPENIEKILQEHILGGKIVEDLAIYYNKSD